jgi:hypothetical protein
MLSLLNKSSSLAAASGVTKFIQSIDMNLIFGKASALVQHTCLSLLNKSMSLAAALGVTKFMEMFV